MTDNDGILLLLHLFKGLFTSTTWVSQYQNGKTSLDLNNARDNGVLGMDNMQAICTLVQTDNHTNSHH